MREISWTKNLVILDQCKDALQREFYIRRTAQFGWSKSEPIHQIENQTYQKTVQNQTNFDTVLPEAIRSQASLAVKDEYTFDFLELGNEHSERQLEQAILAKVEPFLMEMGGMYSFVGRQCPGRRSAAANTLSTFCSSAGCIGILICESKDRTIVEYALKESSNPIGVASYQILPAVRNELRDDLPDPDKIIALLRD